MPLIDNNSSSIKTIAGPTTGGDVAFNGIFQTSDGYARVAEGGTIAGYSQGLPVDANGSVCVVTDGTIANYSNGVPVDANGRVVIGSGVFANMANGMPIDVNGRIISLTTAALSVLASFGANAHLWIPGVGYVGGINALNFSDSGATTPAVMDGPVGCLTDVISGTINATQATADSRPILRSIYGSYPALRYDSVDDYLALSSVPFQQVDDHCVISGASASVLAGSKSVFSIRNSASVNPIVCSLRFDAANNQVRALYRDDAASSLISVVGPTGISANTNYVLTARKTTNDRIVRMNGVTGTLRTDAIAATTIDNCSIGGDIAPTAATWMDGYIGPIAVIKGTVNDTQMSVLERWLGTFMGIAL